MLAHVVEFGVAISVRPQPALGSIKARTILSATGEIPKRNRHIFSVDPFPIDGILGITNSAQPVLAIRIIPVSAVEFPAEEALQSGRSLIHQCSATHFAKFFRILKCKWMFIVEDVTFSIISGGTSQWLITECGTLFN